MKTPSQLFGLAIFLLLAHACPVAASEQSGVVFGSYWSGFVDHWEKVFQQQNGIAMTIVGVGLLALFIITRGKWQK
jgi:hypothetical protein